MFNIPTVTVAKTTLTSTSDSVTLTYAAPAGVSWTPRHLLVRMQMLATSGYPNIFTRFNGDSGANYGNETYTAYGTTKEAYIADGVAYLNSVGNIGATTNQWTSSELLITDALSTRSHKSSLCQTGRYEAVLRHSVGRWASTAAITSVTMYTDSSTFAAGSTFELCVVDESFNVGEQILGSAASLDIGSISAADGDLVVIANMRGSHSGEDEYLTIDLNGDTTNSNYDHHYINAGGTSMDTGGGGSRNVGAAIANGAPTNAFGSFVAHIPNFSDGSNDRTLSSLSGGQSDSNTGILREYGVRRNNTAAVTQVTIKGGSSANLMTSSMISVYAVPKNLITRTELSGTASSVTFSSIPQTYDHLEVSGYARTDRSATSDDLIMSLTPVGGSNDTTNANYDTQLFQGSYSTMTAAQSAADRTVGNVSAASETANIFSPVNITFYNYAKTDRHKHSLSTSARPVVYTRGANYFRSNRWENTAAIEAITFTPSAGTNFAAGTVFTLRGISATPSSSDAANINSVVIGSIAAINSIAIASIQAMNNRRYTSPCLRYNFYKRYCSCQYSGGELNANSSQHSEDKRDCIR